MRDATLREAKAKLRQWFSAHATPYVVRVLDECRAGTFEYCNHCKCILGLQPEGYPDCRTEYEYAAELSVNHLGCFGDKYHHYISRKDSGDHLRRLRLIPMLLAEIRRRNRVERLVQSVEVADGLTA